jgi:hypothetical protein
MDLFTTFATDEKLEVEGRWVPFDDKTSFKIAREHNKAFAKLFQREYNANSHALKAKGPAAEALADSLMCRVLARTVLVDWKGPVKLNGEDLGAYSVEGAEKALALKDFKAWVQAQAADIAAFKVHQDDEDAKN